MAAFQHFGPGTASNLSILKLARMKSKHFRATTVRQLSEIRLPSEQRGGMLRTGKVLSSFLPSRAHARGQAVRLFWSVASVFADDKRQLNVLAWQGLESWQEF